MIIIIYRPGGEFSLKFGSVLKNQSSTDQEVRSQRLEVRGVDLSWRGLGGDLSLTMIVIIMIMIAIITIMIIIMIVIVNVIVIVMIVIVIIIVTVIFMIKVRG